MAISALVTPASADTTTIGLRSRRDPTIPAARVIASASPTDVPPNLRTITGAGSTGSGEAARQKELGVQYRCAGGPADDVVPRHDELDVEKRVGSHPTERDGHAAAGADVESGLRPVDVGRALQRTLR